MTVESTHGGLPNRASGSHSTSSPAGRQAACGAARRAACGADAAAPGWAVVLDDRAGPAGPELRDHGAVRAGAGAERDDPVQQPVGRAPGSCSSSTRTSRAGSRWRARRSRASSRRSIRYPDSKAEPAKNFDTELPTPVIYTPRRAVQQTSTRKKVEIYGEPINDGRGFFASLLLGFGPVILLVFLFVWLSRRAAGGQMGALGAFGRSKARRVEGDQTKVTFADVAGHRRGQGRADRGRRLPQEPGEVPAAGWADSAWRAARGPAGHGQDAARARGGGRGGRAVLLDLRVGVRRGDRGHRRLARA